MVAVGSALKRAVGEAKAWLTAAGATLVPYNPPDAGDVLYTWLAAISGDGGAIDCKLDYGSEGPAGQILEGVFTFPAVRGRGIAAGLVAACMAAAPDRVALHVGADNKGARRAYERAGMTMVDRCRLLLLG